MSIKSINVRNQFKGTIKEIIEGPVLRTGATRKIRSLYVPDPDFNLFEISEPA